MTDVSQNQSLHLKYGTHTHTKTGKTTEVSQSVNDEHPTFRAHTKQGEQNKRSKER